MDQPGTMRMSPDGDTAILTTDNDEAPWFHIDGDGRRYWATHDDVKNWAVRKASFSPAPELKWTTVPAGRFGA
jgi:hypothetical protein